MGKYHFDIDFKECIIYAIPNIYGSTILLWDSTSLLMSGLELEELAILIGWELNND